MSVFRYIMGVLDIFGGCPGVFYSVSWGYLKGVVQILIRCPGDI